MHTTLHASGPHDPIRRHLAAAIAQATRADAAVAFITRAGVDFLLHEIESHPTIRFRIVTSVRWPTNIRAVGELATRWPDSVWIHLAGDSPHEKAGDRYQMHSKAMAVETTDDRIIGFVGSHNWTFSALDGVNLEASVEVSCQPSDAFARDLRAHIEACAAEAEPFEAEHIDRYLAIQRALHPGPLPDSSDEVDGFEKYSTIVIHAEDPQGLAARSRLRLAVGPDGHLATEFTFGRRVDLYLYPAGGLLRPERPTATPVYFDGEITLVNTKADAHVEEREVDSTILDLFAPQIRQVPDFPDIRTASREVAIRLDHRGARAPFVYHGGYGQGRPKVRDRVSFVERSIPGLPPIDPADARRYLRAPRFAGGDLLREAPSSIRREIVVDVPGAALYADDPARVLRERFERPIRQVGRSGAEPQGPPRLSREVEEFLVREAMIGESRFVYPATYRSKR